MEVDCRQVFVFRTLSVRWHGTGGEVLEFPTLERDVGGVSLLRGCGEMADSTPPPQRDAEQKRVVLLTESGAVWTKSGLF